MKWICVYCNKVMDRTNFIDFIKESDSYKGGYHGWRRLLSSEEEEEEEEQVQSSLVQCSLV